MPPEPLPWDRKDFVFRERKHDRGQPDALGGGGFSTPRWRSPYRGPRDFHAPSPRRLPGHYKQVFLEEPGGHGCTPSRLDDEGFRCYSGRYGSSSGRDGCGREGRGYFRRSPWSSGDSLRQHQDSVASTAPRSVIDTQSSASSQPLPLKDHHNKVGDGVDDGPGTGHRHDRDQDHSLGSIAWKHPWSRSGSFSLSTKAVKPDSNENKIEASVTAGKETNQQRAALLSPPPVDESHARKKQRLGWGQGLAKYEKTKVEVPEDSSGKNALMQPCSSAKTSLSDTSSKLTDPAGSVSPATPSSVTCNSLRGLDDKTQNKAVSTDFSSPVRDSPGHDSQNCLRHSSIDFEQLDFSSLIQMNSILSDMFQPEDVCSGDSNFTRQTSLEKLLPLKLTILKALEKTEAEIDSFETELRTINRDVENTRAGNSLDQSALDNVSKPLADLCASSYSVPSKEPSSTSATTIIDPFQVEHSLLKFQEINKHDGDIAETVASDCNKSGLTGESPIVSVELHGGHALDLGANSSEEEKGIHDMTSSCSNKSQPTSSHYDDRKGDVQVRRGPDFDGDSEWSLLTSIMDSNRESAREASELICEWPSRVSLSDDASLFSVKENVADDASGFSMKEKVAARKRYLQFKKRALSLKFRVLRQLWKDDINLQNLQSKKKITKQYKHCEVRFRSPQSGPQKLRSSMRSRVPLTGNSTLIPTTEILDFTSRLLSDCESTIYRKNLKMPELILDEMDRRHSKFITSNGLIEDPILLEKEKVLINPWLEEEKKIFMENLAAYGKDFKKIASFLDHKTTADCIEFYYKNHKSESFEAVKKILNSKKLLRSLPLNNYMVASGKKWNSEANAVSLDMLGAASLIVSHSSDIARVQQNFSGRLVSGSNHVLKIPRGSGSGRGTSIEAHAETTAADVLAGIGSAISSEGVSSCVTSSVDPGDKMDFMPVDCSFFSEVSQTIDEEDTCSDEGFGELESVDWTDEEKSSFIRALSLYGRDFGRISHCLGTRSKEQCKIFFSKARKCLGLDMLYQGSTVNGEPPLSEFNGGRSGTDEAYVGEMDSTICSSQSCCKVDMDTTLSAVKENSQETAHTSIFSPCIDSVNANKEFNPGELNQEQSKVEAVPSKSGDNEKTLPSRDDIQFSEVTPGELSDIRPRNDDFMKFHADAISLMNDEGKKQGDNLVSTGEPVVSVECMGVQEQNPKVVEPEIESGRCFSMDGSEVKSEPQQFLKQLTAKDEGLQSGMCENLSGSLLPDRSADDNIGQQGNNVRFLADAILNPDHKQQVSLNLPSCSQKNPQMISWNQVENPASFSLEAPLHVFDGQHSAVSSESSHTFDEGDKEKRHVSHGRDIYQQFMLGNQSLPVVDQPMHIRKGSLHSLNGKEVNGDGKNGSGSSDQIFMLDLHGEKHVQIRDSNSEPPCPFMQTSNQPANVQLKQCSHGTSRDVEEQSVRTGDFKLFGAILTHPLHAQKQPDEAEVKTLSAKDSKPLNIKLSNGGINGALHPSNAETSTQSLGLAVDPPMRSYGFWDGQRIQTGFTSLPESLLLSKIPGVVSGMTYYPSKENSISNNGILIHQRSFSVDGKGPSILPELQKRSGIETLSGFQQPVRVAMNRVNGGGILVGGGGCPGVLDPVAALRLHYSRQGGLLGSEEESWRGELGGR